MSKHDDVRSAIELIDDDLLCDAIESTNVNTGKNKRFPVGVIEAAACVVLICAFIAASFILSAVSRKNVNNTATDGTKAETDDVKVVDTDDVKAVETDDVKAVDTDEVTAADTKNGDPRSFINLKVEYPSIKRIYTFEHIKDFLPEKIPENLTYGLNSRFVPGEYECGDGVYRPFKEKIFICLRDKDTTIHDDGYIEAYEQGGYVELQILIQDSGFAPTEELSIDDIEKGFGQEGNDRYGMKKSARYSIAWNTTDGWQVVYAYKVYPADAFDSAYEVELFNLAASSQYFKDHFLK